MSNQEEEPNKKTHVRIEGHDYPEGQVLFIRDLIERPQKEIQDVVEEFVTEQEYNRYDITPSLISNWVQVIRSLVPFEDVERVSQSLEVRIIVYMAHRCGYSLGEILLMTSVLGASERSLRTATKTLGIIGKLVKMSMLSSREWTEVPIFDPAKSEQSRSN